MNLTHLSDTALDQETFRLVKSERELLTSILHHLREAERRRLFSKLGYKSLFDYAVQRFGYSEDEAYRRISAMRLMKELPQIEEKIEEGALSLTNIAKAQTLFRQEAKEHRPRPAEQKLQLLQKIENCSKSKAQAIIKTETAPAADYELVEYKFRADVNLQQKLKRLSDLHNLAEHQVAELMNTICDIALEKCDPLKKAERVSKRAGASLKTEAGTDEPFSVPDQKSRVVSRYIPAAIKHAVYLRDGGQCQKCGSTRQIEVDHVVPFAREGSNDLANLRLLCRSCNQRAAIDSYGIKKMSPFLKAPTAQYVA